MKTLAILAATAMFALTSPVEASAPAAAAATAAAECPAPFQLSFGRIKSTPIMVGPGDANGDHRVCILVIGDVTIIIDNRP